jgi:uncharacterized protein YndB with AHSA1/START domain
MLGTLEQIGEERWQLRFTRKLAHPPEVVWRAVSEPEQLAAWFPTTIEGQRAAGAPLRFSFPRGQAPPFDGEMLAYEPPSLMEIRWGADVIRIEVHPDGAGSELVLLDTLEERGKAARDGAGWHVCLDVLAAHLDGDASARESMDAWRAVHARYVERLGPEAATVGPPEGFE